jgi:hypothetical protein
MARAIFAEASAIAVRAVLAAFFRDAKLNDWYDYYYDVAINAATWQLKQAIELMVDDAPDKFLNLLQKIGTSLACEIREQI